MIFHKPAAASSDKEKERLKSPFSAKGFFGNLLKKDEKNKHDGELQRETSDGDPTKRKKKGLFGLFKKDKDQQQDNDSDNDTKLDALAPRRHPTATEEAVKLQLSGGDFQTQPVKAKGFPPSSERPGKVHWYRATAKGGLDEIAVLDGDEMYQPTLDDVGNRICAQWLPDDGGNPSSFAQIGPVQLDPSIPAAAEEIINKLSRPSAGSEPPSHTFGLSDASRSDVLLDLRVSATEAVLLNDADSSVSAVFPLGPYFEIVLLPTNNTLELKLLQPAGLNGLPSSSPPPPPPGPPPAKLAHPLPPGVFASSASLTAPNSASSSPISVALNGSSRHVPPLDGVVKSCKVRVESNVMRDVLVFTLRRLCKLAESVDEKDGVLRIDGEPYANHGELSSPSHAQPLVSVRIEVLGAGPGGLLMTEREKALVEEMENMALELMSIRQGVASLENHNFTLGMQVEKLKRDNQQLQETNKAHLSKIDHLSEVAVNERSSFLRDQEVLKTTMRELNNQMSALIASETAAKQEAARLKEQLESTSQTTGAVADLSDQLTSATAVTVAKDQELEKMQDQLRKALSLEGVLKQELAELKVQLLNKQHVSSKLQITTQEKERLELELKRTEGKLKEVSIAHADLEELVQHLTEKANQAETHQKQLEAQLRALDDVHNQVTRLSRLVEQQKTEITVLKERSSVSEQRLSESLKERVQLEEKLEEMKKSLIPQLEKARADADEMTAQRNFFKKKADSLTQDFEKMLKTGTGGMHGRKNSNASLNGEERERMEKRITELEAELKTTEAAVSAFKSAFEQQLRKNSSSKQSFKDPLTPVPTLAPSSAPSRTHSSSLSVSSLPSSKSTSSSSSSSSRPASLSPHPPGPVPTPTPAGSYAQLLKQYQETHKLANILSETISDKDEALKHLRSSKQMLVKRVKELEARLKQVEPLAAVAQAQNPGLSSSLGPAPPPSMGSLFSPGSPLTSPRSPAPRSSSPTSQLSGAGAASTSTLSPSSPDSFRTLQKKTVPSSPSSASAAPSRPFSMTPTASRPPPPSSQPPPPSHPPPQATKPDVPSSASSSSASSSSVPQSVQAPSSPLSASDFYASRLTTPSQAQPPTQSNPPHPSSSQSQFEPPPSSSISPAHLPLPSLSRHRTDVYDEGDALPLPSLERLRTDAADLSTVQDDTRSLGSLAPLPLEASSSFVSASTSAISPLPLQRLTTDVISQQTEEAGSSFSPAPSSPAPSPLASSSHELPPFDSTLSTVPSLSSSVSQRPMTIPSDMGEFLSDAHDREVTEPSAPSAHASSASSASTSASQSSGPQATPNSKNKKNRKKK